MSVGRPWVLARFESWHVGSSPNLRCTVSAGQRSSYPKNWVHVLVGVEPKDTTRPKIRRRKDLLLAASKENMGNFPKAVLPQQ